MAPIIEHPDIRRTLLTMKALTQAARAICLVTAKETDVARRAKEPAERRGGRASRGAADAGRQGLLHRHRLRGGLDGRAGARRHGLHRGDRRGADLSRRAHPADLRGHQRHPGHRPRHAQAAARRRQGDRGLHRRARSRRPTRCAAPTGPSSGAWASGSARRWRRWPRRRAGWAARCARTPTRRSPAPRPICACSASRPAASISRKGALAAARDGAANGQAQPIALARFFAENLATAAPGLKETIIAGAESALAPAEALAG